MDSKKGMLENSKIFICEICNFKCCKKGDYNRHLLTAKHNRCINDSNDVINKKRWICNCGKEYKYDSGFYRHKKTCTYVEGVPDSVKGSPDELSYKDMFLQMMNENIELRKTITDLIPKVGNTTNNNCNNKINNKININMFLNEECKDALTMEQFIDRIEVSMANLFLTRKKGIDEGISNIFIENMNKLSLYERPMHCTDTKREILYMKSEGEDGENAKWDKDKDTEKLKGAIKKIERKQHKNIKTWMDENPGWETDKKLQEEYLDLMRSCTKDVKEQKIIKSVCDNVKLE